MILVFIACTIIIYYVIKYLYDLKHTEKPLFKDWVYSEGQKIDPELALFRLQKARYLQSNIWKDKRDLVLLRDNYQCANCGRHTELNIHHHYGYALIPNEPIECLETLCQTCHKELHDKVGYPQTLREYYLFNSIHYRKRNYH